MTWVYPAPGTRVQWLRLVQLGEDELPAAMRLLELAGAAPDRPRCECVVWFGRGEGGGLEFVRLAGRVYAVRGGDLVRVWLG